MRDIKFRGRITQGLENGGQWVYWGIGGTDMLDALDHDTIGEFAGRKDKNGVKIFEGDIAKDKYGTCAAVEFCIEDVGSCGCCIEEFNGSGFKAKGTFLYDCEIIGNIYENPELAPK